MRAPFARRTVLAAALAAAPLATATAWNPFATTLPDVLLLDHRRRPWRFRSEALSQRPVIALDLIYSGCTSICPLSTRVMAEARGMLREEAGDRLRYLSLTLDPEADTPERLAVYAAAAGVPDAEDWLFLTGSHKDVVAILRALRARFGRPDDHAPVFFVGDGKAPRLSQLLAIPPPDELAATLRSALRGVSG